jgi:hypothetical protein
LLLQNQVQILKLLLDHKIVCVTFENGAKWSFIFVSWNCWLIFVILLFRWPGPTFAGWPWPYLESSSTTKWVNYLS